MNELFGAGRHPLSLRDIVFPRPLSILVLAPHPDDFDAVGLSLRYLHQAGHVIQVAVLTSGASGVEDGFDGATDAHSKSALREREQRESCAFFGLAADRLHFLRLWDDESKAVDDHARLRAWIAARPADLLFMPHGNDSNRTHRRTFESVREVAGKLRLDAWACLNQDAKTRDMRVDLFHDFDETDAQWKAQLLRLHRSQQERNLRARGAGFDQRVLQVNRQAAQALGSASPYAEVFELMRLDQGASR